MKSKILITSLGLIAVFAYAQPSGPVGGMSHPVSRSEVFREVVPSMPQPSMPRPTPQMNDGVPLSGGPQPQVGTTGVTGGVGGNGGAGVPRPDVAPLAVKPTPVQPKPPVEGIANLKSNCENPESCSQYLNMILNKP